MTLQPGDALRVEVVGRLVQQQQVGARQQQPAQRHAPPLTAGQPGHLAVARRTAQGVHGDVDGPVEVPGVGGVDLFLELGLLRQQRIEVGVGVGHQAADLVEAVDQGLGFAQPLHDVLRHRLVGVQAAAPGTGSRRWRRQRPRLRR